VVTDELETVSEGSDCGLILVCPVICTKGLGKTTGTLR